MAEVGSGLSRGLKADLHCHTSDDPLDEVDYSAEMLIDAVSARGFDVLAIACHELFVYGAYLAEYARRRGVLLVPAIEANIEGAHVVILNPGEAHLAARTFEDLRVAGRGDAAFIAPHPFYPLGTALGGRLEANIDLFDAVEYCNLYVRGFNLNRRAVRVAERHGLPMVGNSDCHTFPYEDSTYTWVDGEPTVEGVVTALRAGRVEVETRARPWARIADMMWFSVMQTVRDRRKTRGES